MRSRASIDGHPIHPALIPFPIAFLTGALIFDLLGRVLDGPALWTTGGYLLVAGIVGALVAAVPGLIDYLKTVPPNSSGKRRATKHMIVNLSAVAFFGVALWLRGVPSAEPGLATLAAAAFRVWHPNRAGCWRRIGRKADTGAVSATGRPAIGWSIAKAICVRTWS